MTKEILNHVPVARCQKLAGMQKIVAARMSEGQQGTASVTTMAEVSAEGLLTAQAQWRDAGTDVSVTHQMISATARCLERYPRLNGVISDGQIYEFAEINIALAISMLNDDLQSVVIRNANLKSLPEIVEETQRLIQQAQQGKLGLDDVRGATFTVSNYGRLQHTVWATPIISPGQSGVLGIARVRPRLVDDDSEDGYSVQRVLPLSLTYDHRIINGVPAGRFIEDLAAIITDELVESSSE